ncbi:hypothetical protein [Bacillus weihaiensis]|uniref:hypothetical protein n=1 Tax=Bacillus weihaiensis TaxID=1547283 RepID=UPI0023544CB8|nr:hypothetical protein [Bacillus weihaiensis]
MKELIFTSYQEYEEYMLNKAFSKAAKRELHGEEKEGYVKDFYDRAMNGWKEDECDKWIEKHGYVVIQVWKDESEIGGRKVVRGRPKKLHSTKLNHSIHVRLDNNTYAKLQAYCEKNQLEVSEAIRQAIQKLP